MHRFVSLLGLVVMIGLAWLMSSHKTRVSLRVVLGGLLLQFALAFVLLGTPPGHWLFQGIGTTFDQLQKFVRAGSEFLFGVDSETDPESRSGQLLSSFAFGVLPTIIFFSSIMSVLYHLGVMQRVVSAMAWVMQKTLGVSGVESLAAAANVFVGHTEAPLVVRPYIAAMTRSELNALMVGGFSTISGGLLAAYHGMGIDAGHLVVASVISAPAALVVAKIMMPETESPQTLGAVRVEIARDSVNVIEAAANGATDGLKLAFNVGAMLLAFLALIAMCDAIIGGVGSLFGQDWSLAILLGYVFAPLAWCMGIEAKDCLNAGHLLGLKTVANEFIAYEQLGRWSDADSEIQLSQRSRDILTYALSGFSNFGAIGIQIGGIGSLAPERRSDLARFGLRAMIGGTLACCMTACIAGMLIS